MMYHEKEAIHNEVGFGLRKLTLLPSRAWDDL